VKCLNRNGSKRKGKRRGTSFLFLFLTHAAFADNVARGKGVMPPDKHCTKAKQTTPERERGGRREWNEGDWRGESYERLFDTL
jgi:hypothetical protein